MMESFHPLMAFHEHIRLDVFEPDRIDRTQILVSTVTPTVIPIRDPLASLISRQVRINRTGKRGDDIVLEHVNLWVALAETWNAIFKNFAHIKFLPWDLIGRDGEIAEILTRISVDLGLKSSLPSIDCAKKMIHNNNLGAYELKRAYLMGDLETIKTGVSGNAVDDLISKQNHIRPLLEFLGYRDLMWWS